MLTLLFGIAPEDSCAVWFCQLEDKVWFEETCPAVSHIWSLTRSPLISIVRILKSTPADIWGWKYTWLGPLGCQKKFNATNGGDDGGGGGFGDDGGDGDATNGGDVVPAEMIVGESNKQGTLPHSRVSWRKKRF